MSEREKKDGPRRIVAGLIGFVVLSMVILVAVPALYAGIGHSVEQGRTEREVREGAVREARAPNSASRRAERATATTSPAAASLSQAGSLMRWSPIEVIDDPLFGRTCIAVSLGARTLAGGGPDAQLFYVVYELQKQEELRIAFGDNQLGFGFMAQQFSFAYRVDGGPNLRQGMGDVLGSLEGIFPRSVRVAVERGDRNIVVGFHGEQAAIEYSYRFDIAGAGERFPEVREKCGMASSRG